MRRRTLLAAAGAATAGALAARARAQSADAFDLVIQGGTVVDPGRGMQARADLAIRAGTIAAIEPDIAAARAARALDARGKLVTPGLIDLHTHIYPPRAGARPIAEELAGRTAVTTWVSAGDAAIQDLTGFRRFAARHTRCRVYAFAHVADASATSTSPTTSIVTRVAAAASPARILAQYRDLVIGLSVRPAAGSGAETDVRALERAIAIAEQAQTRGRILCSVAGTGQDLHALLERLRPGDILSHAYGTRDLVADDKLLSAALAARQRGVVIDVGHGLRYFDVATARAAIEKGLTPDVLSSAAPDGPRAEPSLTAVMSQFLNLGFSLEQVLAMTTVNPARVIGRDARLGTLDLGAPADVSILELRDGPAEFTDARGERWRGDRVIVPVRGIRAGVPLS